MTTPSNNAVRIHHLHHFAEDMVFLLVFMKLRNVGEVGATIQRLAPLMPLERVRMAARVLCGD